MGARLHAIAAEVVAYAHERGITVEAELGETCGKGAHAPGVHTDSAEAKQFVADTGVDGLAVAVGSEHAGCLTIAPSRSPARSPTAP